MNQSFDYVALVEQHLADEKLARRLQQQESEAFSERAEVVHRPLPVINEDEPEDDSFIIGERVVGEASQEDSQPFRNRSPRRDFIDQEAIEGEPESPSTESEPPGQDLDDMDDVMEDDSILDHYDDSFIDDRNATNVAPGGGLGRDFDFEPATYEQGGNQGRYAAADVTMHVPDYEGLSLQQLRNLPRSKPTQLQKDKSCAICMDNFSHDEEILTLPCFHIFHFKCVKKWFEKKNHCPECRADARKFSFS